MIKKLFTLLTLALLAMPLAWGDDFYLVGNFNMNGDNWVTDDANYKFSVDASASDEDDTAYTLTVQIPNWVTHDNKAYFQIYKGGTAWGPVDNAPWNIGHTHNGYSGDMIFTTERALKTEARFILQSPGTTTFTFKYKANPGADDDPWDIHVYREPKLSIMGNCTNWQEEAMTQTSTGWTISKAIYKNQEFRFVDEFGEWQGWTGGNYGINDINNAIPIKAGDNVFQMNVDGGDYIINVNSAVKQMVIYNNTPESKSLADIQSSGVVGKPYTVNEDLQVVFINSTKNFAIARDLGNSTVTSPEANAAGTQSDPIDYMRYGKKTDNAQAGAWQENNWVMLDFTGTTWLNGNNSITEGETIDANTFKGVYTDGNNYTIKVDPAAQITCNTNHSQYTPNVYCPANFHSSNTQQGADGKYYWFKTPKPMEVFELTWALWYNSNDANTVSGFRPGFYMQHGESGLKGGIGADMNYNSQSVTLTSGASYKFLTVAMNGSGSKGDPLRAGSTINPDPETMYPESGSSLNNSFHIAPLNLTATGDQVITAVSEVKTGSDVVSVTYCDLAGRVSQKPFAGVNIIVTRYSDGTVKTTKAIK